MLYVVTLTYLRAASEIEAQLDTHRAWLIDHARAGRILVAGPLDSGTGGLILAHCQERAELDQMLEQDSFHVHRLVDYHVQAFTAALHTKAFAAQWAPQAKAV
jgi:uncharacterized protein YciI